MRFLRVLFMTLAMMLMAAKSESVVPKNETEALSLARMQVAAISQKTPMFISPYAVLRSVTMEGRSMVYQFRIRFPYQILQQADISEFAKAVKRDQIKRFCSQRGLHKMLQYGINQISVFQSADRKHLFRLELTQKDCSI